MTAKTILIIPIPWYRRDQYDRLQAACTDGHRLPAAYDKWLNAAQTGFEELSKKGRIVRKVDFDLDAFLAWCKLRGVNIDSRARQHFSSSIAIEAYKAEHPEITGID